MNDESGRAVIGIGWSDLFVVAADGEVKRSPPDDKNASAIAGTAPGEPAGAVI